MRPLRLRHALFALCLTLPAVAGAQEKEKAAPRPDPAIAPQLQALDYKYEIDDDGVYKLVFDMDEEGKRTQLVFVRSAVEEYAGQKVREVISPGYEGNAAGFPANVANRLLEASLDSIMWSWGKQDNIAVFSVRIPADADKETLDAAITAAINSADQMEAELTPGKDEF